MPHHAPGVLHHSIGTLNEKPLHASLKRWLAKPGDEFEVKLDGFLIDIVRGNELIEIQTKSLGALKRKLKTLTKNHKVNLVYPIPFQKWIVRIDGKTQKQLSRRKSPKSCNVLCAFEELVSIAQFLTHPNLMLTVLLINEDEIRRHDPKKAWRRKGWVVEERRLIDVHKQYKFSTENDYLSLLPSTLPGEFTTANISQGLGCAPYLSQKVLYCFKNMGLVDQIGKKGRHKLYALSN